MKTNIIEPEVVIELRDVIITGTLNRTLDLQIENWSVHRGEYWVIGGFHGSGKTDLINTLSGLQPPKKGTVRILGDQIESLHGDELLKHRRRIGVVFEHGGRLFSRLNVLENLALPLQYHTEFPPDAIMSLVQELMDKMGLSEFANRRPESLNLSWQQRIALARAIVLEPEIVLLDRPFSAVELRHRRWWHDFLGQVREGKIYSSQKKATIVVTSDDLYPWLEFGTHFGVLRENKLILAGDATELKRQTELREMWDNVGTE